MRSSLSIRMNISISIMSIVISIKSSGVHRGDQHSSDGQITRLPAHCQQSHLLTHWSALHCIDLHTIALHNCTDCTIAQLHWRALHWLCNVLQTPPHIGTKNAISMLKIALFHFALTCMLHCATTKLCCIGTKTIALSSCCNALRSTFALLIGVLTFTTITGTREHLKWLRNSVKM